MKKPVLALLSIILLTAGCSQRPAATTKIPLTSAHRGAATIAPENTMASVDSCIKYGVGNIECDVCISKDSVFYVLHDSTSTVPPTVPAPSPNGCPPTSTHWMPALGLRPDLPDNGYYALPTCYARPKSTV